MSVDRLSFRYDPNGSDTHPVAVSRYGALMCRVSLDDARTMRRHLNDALVEADQGWCVGRHHVTFREELPEGALFTCTRCPAEVVLEMDGTWVPVAEAGA